MKDLKLKEKLHRTPFSRTYTLAFEEVEKGFYAVTSFQSNFALLPVEQLKQALFFRYEPNFYGLHAKADGERLFVTAAEMLECLSPKIQHPFIQFEGHTEEDTILLDSMKAVQSLWNDAALWNMVEVREDGLEFHLPDDFHAYPSDVLEDLLTTATYQKLAVNGLTLSELPSLIPFFKDGGWPLRGERSIGKLKVALRLSEPEEGSDEWLLETVIVSPTASKHWTPAVRKRNLPIEQALPEKWVDVAEEIRMMQKQMLQLLELDSVSEDRFLYLPLTDAEVRTLLRDHFMKLTALGFEVILPGWLKELKQSKMRVRVSAQNGSQKSVAGLDDILSFRWELSIGGEQISPEEFRKMVEDKREFVRVGNEWFRMDTDWMTKIRELMDQAEKENWTVKELVFREIPEELMAPEELEEDENRDDPMFAFEMQRSLKAYVDQLQEKQGLPSVQVPQNLKAELRPYQQQGFEWLVFMRDQQFGAVLADDMGLGKTVQLISYLLHLYEALRAEQPTLIICPTSVLGNWQKELARFAPTLKVHTHYSSGRLKGEEFLEFLRDEKPQVVLSTYGTITQDIEFLELVHWATVVLDEAQNIKNMQTLQSKAIRRLNGEHHIALTGTPIENRLSELWAIFDFIHRGYFGSFGKFSEQFIVPIERDDSERHKTLLRTKIRPFLLRRTKTDPELMLNLPEKQESKEFCPLTQEQAALYEGYIQDTMEGLEQMSPFERKGRILQMLSKLKQLCNHPALYLKEPFGDARELAERSVKLKRILELASEIVENGEQCLIFTQYIGMGHLLQYCFSELYEIDVPFLTGSMPKHQRDHLVASFQAGEFPIFLLSLKAGGTGLNLTAATHVLHADRWWNPAVENQATDRAYRIGQTQFVQVHKFITIGTIEEKVDQMLEMKSALSEELIQSSNWLTELQEEELLDLLTLDLKAVKL